MEAFAGTREDLSGGEFLGGTARPDLFSPGNRITAVRRRHGQTGYYYDPEWTYSRTRWRASIEGTHYEMSARGHWLLAPGQWAVGPRYVPLREDENVEVGEDL